MRRLTGVEALRAYCELAGAEAEAALADRAPQEDPHLRDAAHMFVDAFGLAQTSTPVAPGGGQEALALEFARVRRLGAVGVTVGTATERVVASPLPVSSAKFRMDRPWDPDEGAADENDEWSDRGPPVGRP